MKLLDQQAVSIRAAAMAAATSGASIGLYRALRSAAGSTGLSTDQLLGALVGLGVDALITGTVVPDPTAQGGPLAPVTESDASTPGVDVNHPWATKPFTANRAGQGSKIQSSTPLTSTGLTPTSHTGGNNE